MNFYRKYRPNSFEEVVGQENNIKILKNSIENNNINHAYLFYGPRGTGKTSVAKIFSNILNNNNCKEHPDIWEMDAASNNGVEEIRKIINNIDFLPIEGKYKIYIIDEVHMLSKGAFNALLKTLEEPPKHIIFILATTEIHKIPQTIISRCQRLDFKRLEEPIIVERLKQILALEKINYEDEALNKIAELADGGMRDALSLLEKVYVFDQNITYENVCKCFEIISYNDLNKIIELILKQDTNELVSFFEKLYYNGLDLNYFIIDIQNLLKEKILTNDEKYLILLKHFNQLEERMFYSNNKKLLFQVYLIESCYLFNKKDINNNIICNKIQENKERIDELEVQKKEPPNILKEDSKVGTVNNSLKKELNPEIKIEIQEENKNVVENVEIINQLTLLDVLRNSKAINRKKTQNEFEKLQNYFESKNKFGIATFFSLAKVAASSNEGCLIILEEKDYEIFEKKFHVFKKILKKLNYHSIYILTRNEWEKQRPNYLKQVNEKNNDLEEKLKQYFPNVEIIKE